MKAAVLALLCLFIVVCAAENATNHTGEHPSGPAQGHPGQTANHTPDSGHQIGHDYHCKAHAINETDKAKILKFLNHLRDQTAGGHNGHFPKASNMKQLRWDPILEDEAHMWASNCSAFNSPHSRRRENRTHVVKELVFISTGCHPYSNAKWDNAFAHWAAGNKTAPLSLVANYTYSASRKDADRAFSLLNWANTDLVGCGFSNLETLSHSPVHKQFIVCQFAEGGNQLGQPVYKIGEPASACPVNFTKSTEYPNLCTNHTVVVPPTDPNVHVTNSSVGNDTVVSTCHGYSFSTADKNALLAALNQERSRIALGNYTSSKNPTFRKDGFPSASNMRALVWDDKLASKAVQAASYCKASTADLKTQLNVSEILFAQSSNNSFAAEPQWKTASAYWISRKDNVQSAWLTKFEFATDVAGREASTYTQVIWADSWDIGCAFANQEDVWTSKITKHVTRSLHIQYIICHFTNPGDIKGQPVYLAGEACKACPTGFTKCDPHVGLCSKP